MREFFIARDTLESDYSVIVEGDGRVAYAYFITMPSQKILSHVWLYNIGPDLPGEEEVEVRGRPSRNPAEYILPDIPPGAQSEEEIEITFWYDKPGGEFQCADVSIRGIHWATLAPSLEPGLCRFAAKDNDLAGTLIDE